MSLFKLGWRNKDASTPVIKATGWEWEFKALTRDEYELKLESPAESSIFKKIVESMAYQDAKGDVEAYLKNHGFVSITKEEYLHLLWKSLNPTLKNIFKELAQDNIVVLSDAAREASVSKLDNRKWLVKVIVKGLYADKRG